MINAALSIYGKPTSQTEIDDRVASSTGPFRAMSAYKGDEEKGEREWPWIVVGAANVNIFGRLWHRDDAIEVARLANERKDRR